ncbi:MULTISPECIES: hypothetical protein [Pseudoalteromonas]|uniref:hypothetical protein n=1 Tax=Pseudoalteromonas TaxID=53246 RepID=UPI0003464603|nr:MULTISPECIES: hypothetical protein [Pseudoalteromonas]MCF2863364.1 hypothetical protein [Pseudoalteromonas sp. CNAT2-18]MCG7544340.1 hypothetical protein [Pseudoalteromonas sp. MM17-2]MCG7558317.1 hypothetical protein [Pseudoalteromonas sp. CNAT2-18.1]MCG7567758.1 hypothetical protein [Pseudoalteromonas sp. CnMc7-15]MCG7570869.1 hypothetical protein [Pseudoalteromonas sp. CNC9-20]|tara:strand:- start:2996 stop:3172 length:177 start_codon:yes stop_codon:yes gene_type:complete
MNAIIIIIVLFVSLAILVPLLERYQHQLGLNKMMRFRKYILPLVGISLVVQLLYMLFR